ncbi:MAG: hypothetical protein RL095_2914 [Verrucomicrobiota bacterium]|jgi:predicted dehydrogenase
MAKKIRVLVVGCGNMGKSHALAYHNIKEFDICGLVARGESKVALNKELGGKYQLFDDYDAALATAKPDAVCISTYPDTHEEYALKAFKAGAHVFLEKPVAPTVAGCERVVAAAKKANKKLVVGYILRHHPSWTRFVSEAQKLGKPLVMRMNLNQQSKGKMWDTHKNLMNSMSPIVDCGVHYVDMMCLMTQSRPVSVSAIGARLSEQIDPKMYNYGQLQVRFEDGSVGWYEAGWGPMASTKAFFVKDVWGPKGCVTITAQNASDESQSDNVDAHTKTEQIRVHHAAQDKNNEFIKKDDWISTGDEPDHNGLCEREQRYFLDAIVKDVDLSKHMEDAINSLKIVLAADESVRKGKTIDFAKSGKKAAKKAEKAVKAEKKAAKKADKPAKKAEKAGKAAKPAAKVEKKAAKPAAKVEKKAAKVAAKAKK